MNRYARQIAVPEFGVERQVKLREGRILVVGAGGLAAPVLPYLIGAGVAHIRLVYSDIVDMSNLHRQILFREGDIGRAKVEVAADHLRKLNSDAVIDPVQTALDPANAAELLADVTLVLDCADSFAVSYILSDLCQQAGCPLISASVTGMAGYAAGFCGGAPSLRAVFPDLPQRMGNCAEDGVLGPVVGMIGALQAQMALALLAGIAPSPLGRLVSYDALNHRFGGFDFSNAPEPAHRPAFIARAAIMPDDFIVDLRRPDEGPLAHPKARRLSVDAFDPGGPFPAPDQRAVLVCASGLRAWNAAARLAAQWQGDIALVAIGTQGDQQ